MKIRVLKMFSSTVIGGNHKRGDVIDLTDAYGKHLIQHGLAEEIRESRTQASLPDDAEEQKQPDPIVPVTEETHGVSLPADQVSQKKTAIKSSRGGQKVKKGKSR
jgi:hypothetical protein